MTKNKNFNKNLLSFILKKYNVNILSSLGKNISLNAFETILISLLLETKKLSNTINAVIFKERFKNKKIFPIEQDLKGQIFATESTLTGDVLFDSYRNLWLDAPKKITAFHFKNFVYYYQKIRNYLLKFEASQIFEEFLEFTVGYSDFLNQQIVPNTLIHINIRYACNNIFCTFKSINPNKIIYATSTGKEKLKASKKNLHFISKTLLKIFLERVKNYFLELEAHDEMVRLIATLIVPQKSRNFILLLLEEINDLKVKFNIELVLHFKENKCFNGCRPKKQQRKKRKGFRHLR